MGELVTYGGLLADEWQFLPQAARRGADCGFVQQEEAEGGKGEEEECECEIQIVNRAYKMGHFPLPGSHVENALAFSFVIPDSG